MRVLITGGAGFIGSNLAETLINDGHEVRVIDNLSTGRIENLNRVKSHPDFLFVQGSVADKAAMAPLYEWCDQCYHLAAPVGVKFIMDNPVLSILENVRGIDVVMELADKHRKKTLVASTSEVYGKSLDLLDPSGSRKLCEDDYRIEGSTMNHRWAYANTKSLDEFLALAYYKERQTPVVVCRFFNTVGPRQLSLYGMVIPNFVQQALRNEDVRVFGDGLQQRSFLHVEDAIKAIKLLMDDENCIGEVFNVGNPFEVTMNALAEMIINMTGSQSEVVHISYEQAYGKGFEDMRRRTADISKLKAFTGFEIGYDLEDILKSIIDYQRSQAEA